MASQNIDAYIIPSSDPHQSEYLPSHWESRAWVSGFTGSAGTAVITNTESGLWTDSRYFIQAEKELSASEFILHKHHNRQFPKYIEWLMSVLPNNSTIAIDGPLFSINQKQKFEKMLSTKEIKLKITNDLINEVWKDRPLKPTNPIFEHHIKFTGKTRGKKLDELRAEMTERNVGWHLITTLDDIAWLFNLRGGDVSCNPVFVAFAVINLNESYLFIDNNKVEPSLKAKLKDSNIMFLPYEEIFEFLKNIGSDEKILIDKTTINCGLYDAISHIKDIKNGLPTRLAKAIKNNTELGHIKNSLIKDGVALTHAFYWLENQLISKGVSEYEFGEKLAFFRSQQADYYGESFNAIVGYQGNGAIVHYSADKSDSAIIKNEGVLLVDSGGQYHDGTTDITRTIALSPPNDEVKSAYTRVLKGHIALANAIFPEGTCGGQLDILARKFLWEDGKNFLHGTGHGVGFFLNVHEPPQGFAPATGGRAGTSILEGMLTSNEPGYYKEDAFGIRIENLIVAEKSEYKGFLKFETVTLFPIDTTLIDKSILNESEINWINAYHEEVANKLIPHLELKYQDWIKDKCQKI
ncbi:MAG: aminopeptidase P family protein [Saprospiraceae bacterium]|nr:aminopeptidase P family protein [Saprospiraceae bacterium]